jgi:hypothetical protein
MGYMPAYGIQFNMNEENAPLNSLLGQITGQQGIGSPKEKIRVFINASALKTSGCIRRAYWHSVIRYRSTKSSVEAEFGKAVHTFINVYRQTDGNANLALKEAKAEFAAAKYPKLPKKEWMNEQRLEAACIFWQSHWLAEDDDLKTLVGPTNQPITELKGAIPYWSNDHVEVVLDFVIDDLCRKGTSGAYCVRDYKTTGAWDIPTYLADYRLSPQLLFYYIVIEHYAKFYPDSIYAEMMNKGFGCLIEGIFLKQYGEIKIQRSDMFMYDTELVEGFRTVLNKFVVEVAMAAQANIVPPPQGILTNSCKYCDFKKVCGAVDPVAGSYVLDNQFVIKPSMTLTEGDAV